MSLFWIVLLALIAFVIVIVIFIFTVGLFHFLFMDKQTYVCSECDMMNRDTPWNIATKQRGKCRNCGTTLNNPANWKRK